MNSNDSSKDESINSKSSKPTTDKYCHCLPSTYLTPDLYLLLDLELQSSSIPKNRLLYILCALMTFMLISLGFLIQFSEMKQAFQNPYLVDTSPNYIVD